MTDEDAFAALKVNSENSYTVHGQNVVFVNAQTYTLENALKLTSTYVWNIVHVSQWHIYYFGAFSTCLFKSDCYSSSIFSVGPQVEEGETLFL